MSFHSYVYILAFLPVTALLYWLVQAHDRTAAKGILILASFVFYAWANPVLALFLAGYAVLNYLLVHLVTNRPKLLWIAVILDVFILGYYKYTGFLLDTWNVLFQSQKTFTALLAPLGLSFLTFRMISALADAAKQKLHDVSFINFLLYASFFPVLIQGPIVYYNEILDQFDSSALRPDAAQFAGGMRRIICGLAKKLLLADMLGKIVAWGFSSIAEAGTTELAIVALCYTLQLYFDFSGYCDMANGSASILGITLPENFDSPYRAISIGDFWRRWHITLSRFLKDYVYFPLGGSRKGPWKTYRNTMIIFLISGIWHGAAWTFLVWGAVHGLLVCLERAFRPVLEKVPSLLRWFVTFLLVNVLWVLFRAESFAQFSQYVVQFFRLSQFSVSGGLILSLSAVEVDFLQALVWDGPGSYQLFYSLLFLVLVIGSFLFAVSGKDNAKGRVRFTPASAVVFSLLFVYCLLSMSGVTEFLYQRF